jgi:hypothetical protein
MPGAGGAGGVNMIRVPLETEDDFFFMSNLPPSFTGLPFVVWISQKGYAKYDCRVKVSMGPKVKPGDLITVTVRPEVREISAPARLHLAELRALTRWIELNREVLVKFWEGDIAYTNEVLEQLKPLPEA